MNYHQKYLKYKKKYLNLKNQLGGRELTDEEIVKLNNINQQIENEPRVLNFFNENIELVLPNFFINNQEHYQNKMMLAAGDGFYINRSNSFIDEFSRSIQRPENMPTDIEFMYKIGKYNIFCCHPLYNQSSLEKNINFIKENPTIPIILCLCDLNNDLDCWKLVDLFTNKINLINTHDSRFYIPANIAYRILIPGGKCIGIRETKNIYVENMTPEKIRFNEKLKSEKIYEGYFTLESKWFDKRNFGYTEPKFTCDIQSDSVFMTCVKNHIPQLYRADGRMK
jgi:hypothetical protein